MPDSLLGFSSCGVASVNAWVSRPSRPVAFLPAFCYQRQQTSHARPKYVSIGGSCGNTVIPFPESHRNSNLPTRLRSRKRQGIDEEEGIVKVVETLTSVFSRPIGGSILSPPLSLGYPIFLFAAAFFVPFSTFVLLLVGFGIYSWLGRTFVLGDWEDDGDGDDDLEDQPPTDLLALGAAAITSGLLTPILGSPIGAPHSTNTVADTLPSFWVVVVVTLSILSITLTEAVEKSPVADDADEIEKVSGNEQKLMDLWDKNFQQERARQDPDDD